MIMAEERIPCCKNCGYKTVKKDFWGQVCDWCCFQDRKLKKDALCPQYMDEVEVGVGKALYLKMMEVQRPLTEAERKLQALIDVAVTVPDGDEDLDITSYCTEATPQGLDALFELGQFYHKDIFVERDDKLAFFYYKIAANQGYAAACTMAGLALCYGRGTKQDRDRALQILRKAADKDPFAGYLAGLIEKEKGSSGKLEFAQSAEMGHAGAQYELAEIYVQKAARGREKCLDKAIFWYVCAYLHGSDAPLASRDAKAQIIFHEQNNGYPHDAVEQKIRLIRSSYSRYLITPKCTYIDLNADLYCL